MDRLGPKASPVAHTLANITQLYVGYIIIPDPDLVRIGIVATVAERLAALPIIEAEHPTQPRWRTVYTMGWGWLHKDFLELLEDLDADGTSALDTFVAERRTPPDYFSQLFVDALRSDNPHLLRRVAHLAGMYSAHVPHPSADEKALAVQQGTARTTVNSLLAGGVAVFGSEALRTILNYWAHLVYKQEAYTALPEGDLNVGTVAAWGESLLADSGLAPGRIATACERTGDDSVRLVWAARDNATRGRHVSVTISVGDLIQVSWHSAKGRPSKFLHIEDLLAHPALERCETA